jgi:hypothetical protein
VQGGYLGTGNIDADPLFDTDGIHLLEGSPCVNAGDPDGDYTDQADVDGEDRVQQCRVDMGADETPFFNDCNGNGFADACDLLEGTSEDCQPNDVPDECDIAGDTSEDCQSNGVPDECDIAGGTSDDLNGNGVPDECDVLRPMPEDCGAPCETATVPCEVDDDCANDARCIDGICYAPKHRYLSIARNPDQAANTARRLKLDSGEVLGWAGVPYQNASLWLADVVGAPVYADADFTGDWPAVLHLTDCEVATGQTYEIQAIILGQDIGNESNYSEALLLHTPTKWGDVVATCPADECGPASGFANLDDIMAKIKYFQAVPVAPLTWLDDGPSDGFNSPNQGINLTDIMNSVYGFQGHPYPGNGPLGCNP